ncbi:hypothetical protein D1866_04460 [Acidianus ambivalens]|uniref:Uncharacterized protein n=2 Tax=Acidianus ambivalens TaxID=2283 RepID=A0A650CV36_ACIAM|nr:hypothetical protein D1866_04460 [Acidianus ambivalens]
MIELRKVLVFRSLFMIADISTGYFLLWRLMGIIGLTLTFTFFMISEFISPHIGLLVSPFVDKYKKDKFQLLRVSYIIDMMLFIILYPLFLYLYVVKDLFLIVFTVGMIASTFIKSVEYKILGVTVRYLIKDYRNEVYSIRKYGLLTRAIGTILGTSLLSLNITENLTVILILYLIGLRLLSNINIDGEIKTRAQKVHLYLF